MRTLSATLLAAQRAASGTPYVRVRLRDHDIGVARLRWERWYTGGEAAGPCAAAVPADGSLLRARIDASTGTLYHQRVASPGAGSTYSAWTSLGTVVAAPRLGLGAAGTRALLVTVRNGGVDVEVRESTDSGAAFGASSLLVTAGGTVTAVACTLQASGTAAVFYAVAGVVYVITRTGTGSWSSPAAWTHSLASVSGLAATFDLDHQVLVSGATSAGVPGAWSTTYGAGGAAPPAVWMSLVEVTAASVGTSTTYLATALGMAGAPRAAIVETYSGGGSTSRAHVVSAIANTVFADQQWRDPRPLDVASSHGVGLAGTGTHGWLATPGGVWHATLGAADTELGADVLELDLQQGREQGRLHLVLRNEDGRYGAGAAPAALAAGGELLVDPGYLTANGAESSEGSRFWITLVRRHSGRGGATVEVEAVDGWGVLEAWTAPRQLVWNAGAASAASVMLQLAMRAGLRVTASGASAESGALQPAFTVRSGERGALALRRLLAMLPDHVVMRGTEPVLHEPVTGDATAYAFGTVHAISAVRLDDGLRGAGWARVFGKGVFAEAVDAPALRAGAGTAVVVDDNLAAQARADARATTVLRRTALAVPRGELVAPPNVGQEVGDVIEVTSSALGLTAARFRVASLRLRFARGGPRPLYEMTLALSDV